jgi:hypothetical protein
LKITYADQSYLIILPDQSEIFVTKGKSENEEARTITTLYTKGGYSPVKITSDPFKAKSGTVIGLGGADALMGTEGMMERSNGGLLSEVFLPDQSVIQTHFEKQTLAGINNFSYSLIHLIRRSDYSTIKVR